MMSTLDQQMVDSLSVKFPVGCGRKIGPFHCCSVVLGDCLDLLKQLPDRSVDFVFTDPPYGHNNNNGDLIQRWEAALGKPKTASSAARPILNDAPENAERVTRGCFRQVARLLRHGGCCCCCCCGGGGPDPQFARWSLWLDEQIPFKHAIVWDKGGLGMGWHYRRNYEFVLVAQAAGGPCKWYGGNDVPNVIRHIPKIIPSETQHPTQKPVELAAWFVRLHSAEGDLVLDPFSGSGSTLVAAKRLGRHFLGFELEWEHYADSLDWLADIAAQPDLFEPAPEQLAFFG